MPSEIVRADLRGDAKVSERTWLADNKSMWRTELIRMKLSCESQMVASKARRFQTHKRWVTKEIDQTQYLEEIESEKQWKCNANRFLQQIETKLQEIGTP